MAGPAPGRTPFAQVQAALAVEVRKRFPHATPAREYGIDGWRIRRPRPVEWTHGTVDPNFVMVGLADRKRATVLHLWNPLDWRGLAKSRSQLEAAGFQVMVGCLQFTRAKPYPMDAIASLLDKVAADFQSDAGQVPPYRTPRPRNKARKSSGKAAGARQKPATGGSPKKAAAKPRGSGTTQKPKGPKADPAKRRSTGPRP